jgi:hypothetical protein
VRGEAGHDIIPELYPLKDEPVIDEPGKGAFYQTDLELMLHNRGIDTLFVCGVTTEVCVNTTVREANDRGFRCIVLSDCCALYFPQIHEAGLAMIKAQGGIFGSVAASAVELARQRCPDRTRGACRRRRRTAGRIARWAMHLRRPLAPSVMQPIQAGCAATNRPGRNPAERRYLTVCSAILSVRPALPPNSTPKNGRPRRRLSRGRLASSRWWSCCRSSAMGSLRCSASGGAGECRARGAAAFDQRAR